MAKLHLKPVFLKELRPERNASGMLMKKPKCWRNALTPGYAFQKNTLSKRAKFQL